MAQFTNRQKAKEAQREVAMRERVYGKSGPIIGTRLAQVEIMREIQSEYAALADAEEKKGRLL